MSAVFKTHPTAANAAPSIEILASMFRKLTSERAALDKELAQVEASIVKAVNAPEKGTTREDLADGSQIVVVTKINRTLNKAAWLKVEQSIPKELRPVRVVEEYKLEAGGLTWLEENDPVNYLKVCEAITSKPAKPSIRVEMK